MYFQMIASVTLTSEHQILSFIGMHAVGIPALLLSALWMKYAGRRAVVATCLACSGVGLLMSGFCSDQQVAEALNLIAKMFITAAFQILYMYTAELFPTCLRNSSVG